MIHVDKHWSAQAESVKELPLLGDSRSFPIAAHNGVGSLMDCACAPYCLVTATPEHLLLGRWSLYSAAAAAAAVASILFESVALETAGSPHAS